MDGELGWEYSVVGVCEVSIRGEFVGGDEGAPLGFVLAVSDGWDECRDAVGRDDVSSSGDVVG
jgi:hypothetical protein